MANMTPTVGRVVYFYEMYQGNVTEMDAHITAVHSDECVNLVVFPPGPGMFFMSSVMYTPLDMNQNPNLNEKISMVGRWGWMPFQKGQAQKTEEMQESLQKLATTPHAEQGAVYTCPDAKAPVLQDPKQFDFGTAINYLKNGHKVARAGWNGKGMWLTLVPAWSYNPSGSVPSLGLEKLPWIGMKTADNKFVPWLASQSDVLAEDWEVVSVG